MQRKLIKQGVGLTIYLPKIWTDKKQLKQGDQVEVNNLNNDLIISPPIKNKEKTIIYLEAIDLEESALRTQIINAYRLGFDKINLKSNIQKEEILKIINKFMVGFELFETSSKNYSIESFTEPSHDNFENIITKQFFILNQIIDNFSKEDISNDVYRIQKYDNFLKRCISKELLTHPGIVYLWRFLSKLGRVARLFLHFQTEINNNIKATKKDLEALDKAKEMIELLRKSFSKKESNYALQLHNYEKEFKKEFLKNIKKKPLISHHIKTIISEIYLCSSPLVGFIQAEEFNKQSN
jgi:phosphate uptake regulator